jgi:hypothetical protein
MHHVKCVMRTVKRNDFSDKSELTGEIKEWCDFSLVRKWREFGRSPESALEEKCGLTSCNFAIKTKLTCINY